VRPYCPSQQLCKLTGELLSVPIDHEVEIPESAGDEKVPRRTSNQIDTEAESLGDPLDGFQQTAVYPPSPIFEELGLLDTQGD